MVFEKFFKKRYGDLVPQQQNAENMNILKEQIAPPQPAFDNREESIPAPARGNLDMILPDNKPFDEEMPLMHEGSLALPDEEFGSVPMVEEPMASDFPHEEEMPEPEFTEPQATSTLRDIKGPVFVSLKKYKELRGEISELKQGSSDLKDLVKALKGNRDSGFDLLEKATDRLLAIEKDADRVNKLMRN